MTEAGGCAGCKEDGSTPPFTMAYQPIVDAGAGTAFAYEALVRGPAGEGAYSVLSQITAENRYAFDQACRVKAIEGAVAAGLMESGAKLSINFLPNAVYSPLACIQLTLKTARAVALPLDRLIFEFTENEEIASPAHIEAIVASYKQMGFSVAIDDFGAGHSGLGLFARFAPDIVKIDMELVRGIESSARRRAIVRGIVGICAELDTRVIAEGIETAEEAEALAALGVRYMQGYHFARPEVGRLPPIQAARRTA